MPTSKDYYLYVAERLKGIDFVSFKKMMGEYIIYYKDKVVGGIYDDRFMLKITRSSEELIPDAPKDIPYENAKETFVIEDDVDKDTLLKLCEGVYSDRPPKKRG